MEPASKVSVPLTVVMRTAVRAAPNAIIPALLVTRVPFVSPVCPLSIQLFPEIFVMIIFPEQTAVATDMAAQTKPDVAEDVDTDAELRAL